jgi:anti-anti-sigma factor
LTISCVEDDRSRIVVTVHGELDLATAPYLRDVLVTVLGHSATERPARPLPAALVVDVSSLELLSAAGATVLYAAHQLAADVGVRLRLVAGVRPSASARILRITGLDSVLDVYPSLKATVVCLPPLADL